jgi:dTDP-glucose 4,6-dehydratase
MRIVVSGAAGFIGSHLADHLIGRGFEVLGVDSFLTGSRGNIAHLEGRPGFGLIEQDVAEPLRIDGPVDQVYHLASPASPRTCGKLKLATVRANSQGTWNLLELAVEKNARFLLASSSGIYGEIPAPQKEDHPGSVNPVGIRSMYDESKRFAETIAMTCHRERGADTRIVRIFNTYGPRTSLADGRAIVNFILQALAGEPLTVYGDGTQTRSLCYVSDMVRGIAAAMDSDFHEPINLGNPDEVSVVQLAREIVALVPGTPSTIGFEPGLPYDPRVRRPDISRARQILAWSPTVPREEGLARTIEYYRGEC